MVEQPAVNRRVTGSSPVSGAKKSREIQGSAVYRTVSAQKTGEITPEKMKFPVRVKHRRAEVTIYGKTPNYDFYRLAYFSQGKRFMRSFTTYSEARQEAERIVRQLAAGSMLPAFSDTQLNEFLAAQTTLQKLQRETGTAFGIAEAISLFASAQRLLPPGYTLPEAVRVAAAALPAARHKLLADAVEQFNRIREAKTHAPPGKRPQLHPTYYKDTARWLSQFSGMLPGYAVSQITKDHFELFLQSRFKDASVATRNSIRGALKLFIGWLIRNDYLPRTTRLLEADALKKETVEAQPIDFYRADELVKLLQAAESNPELKAVILLQAFGGLRLQECLRLKWRDVFSIPGHIEVAAAASKVRQRRLVEIPPNLQSWLEPYRGLSPDQPVWSETLSGYSQALIALRKKAGVTSRRNGLRHAFVTYHYALHGNENLTAAAAGTSPEMVHQHYRGLAQRREAECWFGITPALPSNVVSLAHEK